MLIKIPFNTIVFIDSNIFIHHFLGSFDLCTNFLKRVEDNEIIGFTSVIVLTEVLHRLMIAEAKQKYKISGSHIVKYLKTHPELIPKLEKSQIAVERISQFGVKVLPATMNDFIVSKEMRTRYKLLTNDSLNLSIMKNNGIINIATTDLDFSNIPELNVWSPHHDS